MSVGQCAEYTPQDEIDTQRGLASHLLQSAASAAIKGDMEAFGYAMDIHHETERRIDGLERTESNRRMRALLGRFREHGPIILDLNHSYGLGESLAAVQMIVDSSPMKLVDVMDGMLAYRPDQFPEA